MRAKEFEISGKKITIREMKIKELQGLAEKINVSFDDILDSQNVQDAVSGLLGVLIDKLTMIFPGLTEDDIQEAYISELEELVRGFIDVNFFGIKKVVGQLLQLRQKS